MKIGWILTKNSLTVTAKDNGQVKTYALSSGSSMFPRAMQALKQKNYNLLLTLLDTPKALTKASDKITVRNGAVFYGPNEVHHVVAERIKAFAAEGLPYQPLVKFLEKLFRNPSKDSIDQLYSFLEHQNLPVTEDGNFLGYKGIQTDYTSITPNTKGVHLDNSIGKVVRMNRNEVTSDKNQACGSGLHVGTLEYAKSFGSSGRVILVSVNPEHVVSVPADCNCQKLRTCEYTVVADYKEPLSKPLYRAKKNAVKSVKPKRDASGRFSFNDATVSVGALYRLRGVRRKLFRVLGVNETKKHGRRYIVRHHDERAIVTKMDNLRRASQEEVARYLKPKMQRDGCGRFI